MTFNEYWHGESRLVDIYKEANELKKIKRNQELWLQGLYNYKAFTSVMNMFAYGLNGNKGKRPDGYCEQPLPITETEQQWAKQQRIEATKRFFEQGQK